MHYKLIINLKFLIISLFLLFILRASLYSNENDSLLNVYKTSENTEERIDAYFSLTSAMLKNDLDSAYIMIDSAMRWSLREENKFGVAKALNIKGIYFQRKRNYDSLIFYFKESRKYSIINKLTERQIIASSNLGDNYNIYGDPDSANKYLNESLDLAKQENNLKLEAKILYDKGRLLNKQGNFEESLKYLFRSRKISEDNHDTVALVNLYNSFGSTYQHIGDFEKSLEFFKMSMKMDLVSDEIDILLYTLNNLGVLYWQNAGNLDSAKYYMLLVLELQQESNKKINEQTTYINLGGIETDDNKYIKALEYYRKAQSMKIENIPSYIESALYINMGVAFNGLFNYDSARYYLTKGLKIAKKSDFKIWQKNAYNTLYLVDSAENKLNSAMYNMSKYYAISDSISRDELDGKIAKLEIKYKSEKKEIENQKLKKENILKNKIIKKQNIINIISILVVFIFVLYIINILINRKKQKQKNLELSEINLTKDKFFSIIAHDLKSPFNAILGIADLLEKEYYSFDEKEKRDLISTLHKSSQNTYELLINLLEWSRMQRGLIKFHPQKTDIHDAANNVINVLEEAVSRKKQIIKNNIPIGSFVMADKEFIKIIFNNIINNSIKFTPKNGEISLTIKDMGEKIKICIDDNGIGIPEDIIPILFNIDCDYNQNGTENEGGTGLGLIIVKELIELMGSSIKVESELDKGSSFCFILPKA